MNRKQYITHRRAEHAAALATLHANPAAADGAAMLRGLRSVERTTHRAATDYCNGEKTLEQWEETKDKARALVSQIFGGALPDGFFINGDPRGYALKLQTAPAAGLETDWGRHAILAPDFNRY